MIRLTLLALVALLLVSCDDSFSVTQTAENAGSIEEQAFPRARPHVAVPTPLFMVDRALDAGLQS